MDPTLVPGASSIPLDHLGWSLGAMLGQIVCSVDWRVLAAVAVLAGVLASGSDVQERIGAATLGTPAEPVGAALLDAVAAFAWLRWRLADLLLSWTAGRVSP